MRLLIEGLRHRCGVTFEDQAVVARGWVVVEDLAVYRCGAVGRVRAVDQAVGRVAEQDWSGRCDVDVVWAHVAGRTEALPGADPGWTQVPDRRIGRRAT